MLTAQDFVVGTNNGGANPNHERLVGSAYTKRINSIVTRQIRFGFLVEQPASPDNRIVLGKYKDNLGITRPKVEYTISDYTAKGFASAKEAGTTLLSLLNVDQTQRFFAMNNPSAPKFAYDGTLYNYQGAGHLCGTHIMSEEPNDGVVNAEQLSWDHENLYIAGCGSHPSVGTENPSLTMIAMAMRTARAIDAQLG